MKKTLILSLIIIMTLIVSGCSSKTTTTVQTTVALNTNVPDDTDVVLRIDRFDDNNVVFGIGTELDPHFLSQNVGLKDSTWECKEEDWALFEERMEEMNLKRIRVMLLPSWFVINEVNTREGIYNYDTIEMKSLYQVLDTAKKLSIKVNITMWGVNEGTSSFMKGDSGWCSIPKTGYEELFVECFADCIKYLMEDKGYDNITEVTLFNEPNSLYSGFKANEDYCDICIKMHQAFQEKGIRDKVKFNLSDDARDAKWLAKTLMNLEGIIDVSNSHTYCFGDKYDAEKNTTLRDMSNKDICYNMLNYNLALFKEFSEGYGVPHIWGEFGTQNSSGSHQTFDKYIPDRGLDIARIALNFFNMGSVGCSYWVLYSQYYSRSDFNNNNIMDMGLWGFADEGYNCRPMYYAYSMITRFILESDYIYTIESDDDNIVAVAFQNGNDWTYAIVNNSDVDKNVSFLNMGDCPLGQMNRFVYDESNVPTNNHVIPSNGVIDADGRVISDLIKARSFVIITTRG